MIGRKKKIIYIIFICSLIISILLIGIPSVIADSGFDAGYSGGGYSGGGYSGGGYSGGSYSGGSFSGGSSSGGGHSSYSYSSNDALPSFLSTINLVAGLILFVGISYSSIRAGLARKYENKEYEDSMRKHQILAEQEYIEYRNLTLKKLGNDFNLEQFKQEVFNIYKDVQIAWMNQELEPVRSLLSDTIYNMYRTQLQTLIAKKQKNIMEDITFKKMNLLSVKDVHGKQEILVTLEVTCRDYIIDINTNEVVKGNKDNINYYRYKLAFIKNTNNEILKECPNCGAPLENAQSDKCEYCNTVVIKNSSNYIMTTKKMLRQTIIEEG